MANTQIRKEQIEFSQSDGAIKIPVTTQDKDFSVTVNDGGTTRTAVQVHGDEGSVSFPRQSRVHASLNGNFTVANNTVTTLIFGTETVDILGEFNPTTGIFTATKAGAYQVNVILNWLNVDNTKIYQIGINEQIWLLHTTPAAANWAQSMSHIVTLSAGGTIKVVAYQNSGGDEVINGAVTRSSLTIVKVS